MTRRLHQAVGEQLINVTLMLALSLRSAAGRVTTPFKSYIDEIAMGL